MSTGKKKNVINFERPAPPVLIPVLQDAKKIEELKADIEKESRPSVLDRQPVQNITGLDQSPNPLYREPEHKRLIREALLEALGEEKEVMINQKDMREKLGVAYATWAKYIKELRETEFYLIRQQRGTILLRR